MKIATSMQMKSIDRRAMREWGIPGIVLMENAAAALMSEMEAFFGSLSGLRVCIVCGKGNNGGDGLALARRLSIRGVDVRVALLARFSEVSGDAKINLDILRKCGIPIISNATRQDVFDLVSASDVVVDAIFGTGLSSPLAGRFSQAVEIINTSGLPVVSVDVPSGIDADTGRVMGAAVAADLTVTMGLLKPGLLLGSGPLYAGSVRVADIGIPRGVIEEEGVACWLIDGEYAAGSLMPRLPDTHKGDYGHVMVLAGSLGKAGAAALAAKAALRSGAGLVSVVVPVSLVPVIHQLSAEVMCIGIAESIDGTIGIGADEEIFRLSKKMGACAIGPGLTTHREAVQVVRNLVKHLSVPMVIDADGLNALAGSLDILNGLNAPAVLTPHPGEMSRLAGIAPEEIQKDRLGIAARFATRYGVTLVLKGAATVVAGADGRMFINSTGNPGMATAGAGDVLTGMIAGFLAQGYPATEAACLGVYIHGLAGDIAAKEKTETAMIAGDIIEKIPEAVHMTMKTE